MGKAPKRKRTRTTLELKDYQWPGERKLYLGAMAGVWVVFGGLAALCAWQAFAPDTGQALHGRHQAWIILLLYPAITIAGLNYLSARPRKMQLKKLGAKAKVSPNNHAELHKLIQDACKLLSLKKSPAVYVIDDDAPYLYAVPGGAGSIIISRKCFEDLRPAEVAAAVSKQLGHLKSGHVSVDLAMTAIRGSNPLIKLVALPVTMLSFILRDWLDTIDYTADRCSLLVTRSLSICTASMVKLAAGAARITQIRDRGRGQQARTQDEIDDAAVEAEKVLTDISPEELEAYLEGGTSDEAMADPAQVERTIKVSRFIEQQRNLRQRIRNLSEWVNTDQCQEALAKVDDIRQQLKGG